MKKIFLFILCKIFLFNKKCIKNINYLYGIKGIIKPKKIENNFCNNNENNCCSKQDFEKINKIWNSNLENKINKKYQIYNKLIQNIFSTIEEFNKICKNILEKENSKIKLIALNFYNMSFNKKKLVNLFTILKNKSNELSNLKKSFFCILCNSNSQNYFLKNEIIYSNKFCIEFGKKNSEALYIEQKIIYFIIENILKIIDFELKTNYYEKINLNRNNLNDIENCYFYKKCKKVCNQFSLVKWNNLIDGDIDNLLILFNAIQKFKNKNFKLNFLIENYNKRENILIKNIIKTDKLTLDKFKNKINKNGLNPYDFIINKFKFKKIIYYKQIIKKNFFILNYYFILIYLIIN